MTLYEKYRFGLNNLHGVYDLGFNISQFQSLTGFGSLQSEGTVSDSYITIELQWKIPNEEINLGLFRPSNV
ncbi:MAG: hypothetical protein QW303_01520 [Nitrososphaerota archaeon]